MSSRGEAKSVSSESEGESDDEEQNIEAQTGATRIYLYSSAILAELHWGGAVSFQRSAVSQNVIPVCVSALYAARGFCHIFPYGLTFGS